MIKVILFDLDGTLLPMDQDKFVKAYFSSLAIKASKLGYDRDKLIKMVWQGTNLMISNDGKYTNEEVFWNLFKETFGSESLKDKTIFDDFYKNEFQDISLLCGKNPLAKKVIEKVKERGYRVVLATNPIFPKIATESRIRWAGIDPKDFEFYTTYENYSHCKPNLEYYRDILDKIN